jgi:ubiquinone/menaquinone biosynthesis C-methylase UbiE
MEEAGFQEVSFRRLMFGSIAIHWGRKPAREKDQA